MQIPDKLLGEAKPDAAKRGVPVRTTMAVRGARRSNRRFQLKTVTTKGEGLMCDGSWRTIRSLLYKGHGG